MMQKAATGDAQCVPVSSRNTGWQHQRPQEDASPLQTLLGRRTGTAGEGRLLHSHNSITSSALSFATGNSDGGQSDREYLLRSFFFPPQYFGKSSLPRTQDKGNCLETLCSLGAWERSLAYICMESGFCSHIAGPQQQLA